jgi:hypothetical protein
MNYPKRTILFFGLVTIVIICLRPPYQWEHTVYMINRESGVPHKAEVKIENIGHCWIWDPPKGWTEQGRRDYFRTTSSHIASVDWPRLGIYVGLTAAVALFGTFVVFSDRKGRVNG